MLLIIRIYCHFILVTELSAAGYRMLSTSFKQKNHWIKCIGKLTDSPEGTESQAWRLLFKDKLTTLWGSRGRTHHNICRAQILRVTSLTSSLPLLPLQGIDSLCATSSHCSVWLNPHSSVWGSLAARETGKESSEKTLPKASSVAFFSFVP